MRTLLVTLVLGALIFGGIAWSQGMFAPAEAGPTSQAGGQEAVAEKDWGPRLEGEKALPEPPIVGSSGSDPIIIPCHLNVIDEGDVPSRTDGKLLFVGERVKPGDKGYNPNVFLNVPNAGKMEKIYYRTLKDNDWLRKDQIVAVVDPILAYTKVAIQGAKLTASVSDYNGADALYSVYQHELERLDKMRAKDTKGVSDQEYMVAWAQRDKYKAEAASKSEAIRVAREELMEATTLADLHFLRNTVVPGDGTPYKPELIRIKTVYKKPGESVKNLEPVLHVYNLGRLRAEGFIDGQYLLGVKEGRKMGVTVEPTNIRRPVRTFSGHSQSITCVAVSSDGAKPFIVTGSDDNTVRVWKRNLPTEFCVLPHPFPVRAVACSPRKSKRNLCLSACADGSVRLWDMEKLSSDPRKPNTPVWERNDQHSDGINCIAFSPDGTMYATGGDDNAINLWHTKDGTKIYKFDEENGHQGAVTALHFTPDLQVISAGRDNTLRVWTLCEKGAAPEKKKLREKRSGSVTSLGVDPQGWWKLFDQGGKLQVISRSSDKEVGLIRDPAGSSPFENLAEFSPDSSLVLTTSAAEGRLQLWKAPTEGKRWFEVRQFKAKESGPVTCAAFGIDSTFAETGAEDAKSVFAVTGTRDGLLHLWAVPGKEDLNKNLRGGTVSLVDANVDPSTGQARIWVDVKNEDAVLKPGDSVTVVVEPLAGSR